MKAILGAHMAKATMMAISCIARNYLVVSTNLDFAKVKFTSFWKIGYFDGGLFHHKYLKLVRLKFALLLLSI